MVAGWCLGNAAFFFLFAWSLGWSSEKKRNGFQSMCCCCTCYWWRLFDWLFAASYNPGDQHATFNVRPLQDGKSKCDVGRSTTPGLEGNVRPWTCDRYGSSHTGARPSLPAICPCHRPLARREEGSTISLNYYLCLRTSAKKCRFTHKYPFGVSLHWALCPGSGWPAHHGGTPCMSVCLPTLFFFSLSLSFLSSLFLLSLSFLFSSSHSSPPPLLYSFPSPPRLLLGCKAQGGHCLCLVRQGFVCRVLIILLKCIDRLCVLLRPCG